LLSALGQHGFAVSIEKERVAVRAKLPGPHLSRIGTSEGEAIEAFARERNVRVMARVPSDPAFIKAMVQGRTIVEFDSHSEGCKVVNHLSENLTQQPEI